MMSCKDPRVVGDEHYQVARDVQRVLQTYKSVTALEGAACREDTASLPDR